MNMNIMSGQGQPGGDAIQAIQPVIADLDDYDWGEENKDDVIQTVELREENKSQGMQDDTTEDAPVATTEIACDQVPVITASKMINTTSISQPPAEQVVEEAKDEDRNIEDDNQEISAQATSTHEEEQKKPEEKSEVGSEVEAKVEAKVEAEEKKEQPDADAKPAGKYSAVTDGTIKMIESMKEYGDLIEATKDSGKPLLVKVCPPCKFIRPLYDALITKYPNLVVKLTALSPDLAEKIGEMTMPTFKLFVDGAENECIQNADRVKMAALFKKADQWYTDNGSEPQIVASEMSKYIKTKSELQSLVSATGKGLKQPLIVKFCRPCQFIAPFIEDLQRKNTDVVIACCDLQKKDENYGQENVDAMPNCFSYVNGKELMREQGIDSSRLNFMIKQTRKQPATATEEQEGSAPDKGE